MTDSADIFSGFDKKIMAFMAKTEEKKRREENIEEGWRKEFKRLEDMI